MKKVLWFLLRSLDNNWGYSTPIQERFNLGEKRKISHFHQKQGNVFSIGEEVTIIETGRHDYLVENSDGTRCCVYQFELS